MESPVALNWLIQEVVREEALELVNNRIILDLDLDPNLPEILGEVLQLERVLWNLLSNAIKFTPRNGRIKVKTSSFNGQVWVTVSDTGVGMAMDELPLLFSEYRRLKGSALTEGSGLGLYIVKNIVKSHGGTVTVESELGKGTTFVLGFPSAAKSAPVIEAQIKLAFSGWYSRCRPINEPGRLARRFTARRFHTVLRDNHPPCQKRKRAKT